MINEKHSTTVFGFLRKSEDFNNNLEVQTVKIR